MAATSEILKPENPNEGWTVVLRRRGKQRRSNLPKIKNLEQQQQQQSQPETWTPMDLETDPKRESKLMQKIHMCMENLNKTEFYRTFLDQIQAPQIIGHFSRVLGSEYKMQMVIYGIGSIESYEPPRLQLSLAILIKRKFDWIGDIEIFDPVISTTEAKVLEALGCHVLSVNEQGRRRALKPTIFFMPHCEAILYDNLLQENWKAEFLTKMVVFGNSFERYEQHVVDFKHSVVGDSVKHVLGSRMFINEVKIETISDDFFRAFHDSSWHFFNLDQKMELQDIQL
ncbi:protein SENSITIVITY TO RED LIGHT REDUCED 1-like [Macadamia integrifolia]|uniref:protein SENSITIVITY TO RED LIGHT REDUCED 1-like n=1 Tax=Macadamia integrifolia TaxID=60698 RepID=UPI001C529766|nr:protein SENSITIVITY TO RED LIGHT REDUCED 1-like [Macadamia integrifolia]XP_042480997.1 protein SENSITIVITY TO RED LIGHT REDUCED 1-like [Macadamia integrifolia]XP_042480998.1 protein SENSITIVITY TO RED LIGHT REDUCED 1-like [Macadamia integrifolia]